jgi:hypothetical protein
VRDEFHLAATAQNLRKLAMLIPASADLSNRRRRPIIRVLPIAGFRRHNYFRTDFFNGIGASRPLPWGAARVPSPNRLRALSLGGSNRSSCPISAIHRPPRVHLKWVDCRPLLIG